MTIPKDYIDIVNRLLRMTNEGRVNWKAGTFGVEVNIEKSRFSMWAGTDEHTDEPFVAFALLSSNGQTLDSWFVDSSDDDFALMNNLHSAAKRYAGGIPQRLVELRSILESAKTIGD
jgi:hypothetical protein